MATGDEPAMNVADSGSVAASHLRPAIRRALDLAGTDTRQRVIGSGDAISTIAAPSRAREAPARACVRGRGRQRRRRRSSGARLADASARRSGG